MNTLYIDLDENKRKKKISFKTNSNQNRATKLNTRKSQKKQRQRIQSARKLHLKKKKPVVINRCGCSRYKTTTKIPSRCSTARRLRPKSSKSQTNKFSIEQVSKILFSKKNQGNFIQNVKSNCLNREIVKSRKSNEKSLKKIKKVQFRISTTKNHSYTRKIKSMLDSRKADEYAWNDMRAKFQSQVVDKYRKKIYKKPSAQNLCGINTIELLDMIVYQDLKHKKKLELKRQKGKQTLTLNRYLKSKKLRQPQTFRYKINQDSKKFKGLRKERQLYWQKQRNISYFTNSCVNRHDYERLIKNGIGFQNRNADEILALNKKYYPNKIKNIKLFYQRQSHKW